MLKLKEKGLPKHVHVIVRDRKYGEGAQVNAPLANRRREDTGDYNGLGTYCDCHCDFLHGTLHGLCLKIIIKDG